MLKHIYLAILCLTTQAVFAPIPNEGKFFYATLEMGEKDYKTLEGEEVNTNVNTMFMRVPVGDTESSDTPVFKLGISTER